jgi:hypothetical protein
MNALEELRVRRTNRGRSNTITGIVGETPVPIIKVTELPAASLHQPQLLSPGVFNRPNRQNFPKRLPSSEKKALPVNHFQFQKTNRICSF